MSAPLNDEVNERVGSEPTWSPQDGLVASSFTTSDGVRLGYRVAGDPKKPALLFCYGLICSAFHFKYQWEELKENYCVLLLDYRGHHASETPTAITSLTFSRIVLDLYEFLNHLEIEDSVSVLGHSMGVNVALEFYNRYSDRVRSLVLMAGAPTFPFNPLVGSRTLSVLHSAFSVAYGLFPKVVEDVWKLQTQTPGIDSFAGLVGFNPKLASPEDIRETIEVISSFSPKVFFQLLGEYLRHDSTEVLSKIAVPTLIIGGEKDRMVPMKFQKILNQSIRGSKLVTVPAGSHVPQFDRPEFVNQVLNRFFQEVHRS